LKQNISKDYKDGAVTYYPHGLCCSMVKCNKNNLFYHKNMNNHWMVFLYRPGIQFRNLRRPPS